MFSGNTRISFHAIRCKSNRYMSSFVPEAIASWNLFMEIFNYKDVPSISSLKNYILSLIRPESKRFFKIHDPSGLRHLFQLRLRLSPLKSHKYNFILLVPVKLKIPKVQVTFLSFIYCTKSSPCDQCMRFYSKST